jgi:pimeloyl-ACP methyl ester carboxylesterase
MNSAALIEEYRRGNLVFDVIDAGPTDGPVVILLHGFPQLNTSWETVIPGLTAQGYRCLAPNQRGYSPRARPTRRRDYRMSELVEDVRALIDASGSRRVHLVGYDWGAVVAWGVAQQHPDRVMTLSALAVPHTAAFLKALATSRQIRASWYIYFNQLPRIPEMYFMRGNNAGLSKFCSRQPSKCPPPQTAMPRSWLNPARLPPRSTGIGRFPSRICVESPRKSLFRQCMCGATATPPCYTRPLIVAGAT